ADLVVPSYTCSRPPRLTEAAALATVRSPVVLLPRSSASPAKLAVTAPGYVPESRPATLTPFSVATPLGWVVADPSDVMLVPFFSVKLTVLPASPEPPAVRVATRVDVAP